MTQLIDRITKIRKETRRRIEVPEWSEPEGDPLALYFSVLTTADIRAVRDRMRADEGLDPDKNREEQRILLFIQKAELEDGTQAFEWGHLEQLKQSAEHATLSRLIAFMYESAFSEDIRSLAEAKKKSGKTPSSSSGSGSRKRSGSRSKK